MLLSIYGVSSLDPFRWGVSVRCHPPTFEFRMPYLDCLQSWMFRRTCLSGGSPRVCLAQDACLAHRMRGLVGDTHNPTVIPEPIAFRRLHRRKQHDSVTPRSHSHTMVGKSVSVSLMTYRLSLLRYPFAQQTSNLEVQRLSTYGECGRCQKVQCGSFHKYKRLIMILA